MTAARRIGLMGGSFNPPHLAHLALGRTAIGSLALDELRWLPAGAPWQKAGIALAPAEQRLAMLELLLEGEARCSIDARELHRPGLTYTLDTVRELQAEHAALGRAPAEWFLVIGQDQYRRFDTWRGWPELLQRVTLAVAARAGEAPQPPAALAGHPHRVVTLPMPRLDIAATDIRMRAARGEPLGPLVGPAVAGYIARHQLYPEDLSSTRG